MAGEVDGDTRLERVATTGSGGTRSGSLHKQPTFNSAASGHTGRFRAAADAAAAAGGGDAGGERHFEGGGEAPLLWLEQVGPALCHEP